jgi:hypothetical protein
MTAETDVRERLERLEGAIHEISVRLDRLESGARASRPNVAGHDARQPLPGRQLSAEPTPDDLSVDIGLAGISVLILGGAYLLRALTESAAMPQIFGVIAGLVYAAIWVWNADRAARAGRNRAAVFHAATASVIAFPLAWETTARFHIIPAGAGAAVVAVLALILLWVGWRDHVQAIAWVANIGAAVTAIAIAWTMKTLLPVMLAVSFVGAATLQASYTRKWDWMVWPATLAADGLAFITLAGAAFHRTGYGFGFTVVAIAMFSAMWLIVIAVRRLRLNEDASLFDVIQTAEVVILGAGGATYVAAVNDTGTIPLGIALIAIALSAYYVALEPTRKTLPRLRLYFGILAAAFAAFGSWLLIPTSEARGIAWGVLALATAEIARRNHSIAMRVQSGIWIVAAAIVSGLLLSTITALVDSSAKNIDAPIPSMIVTALAIATFFRSDSRPVRTTALAIACCGILTAATAALAWSIVPREQMTLALIRTAILAVMAGLLALASRYAGVREASIVAHAVLVVGGIKLLAEDVRVGRAAMLVAAFLAYGCAMLLVSRSSRRSRAATEA